MIRLILMAIVALTAIEFVSAAPEVTDIKAKQRYPWNGLVDIGCKVSGIEGTINGYTFVVVAVDKDSGKEYAATHCTVEKGGTGVSGWEVSGNGDYALLWDARADMGQVVIERMAMRVTLAVPELSAGKVQLWEGGPYWADRNIGADKPWDYGLYFWWGDTAGHRPNGTTFEFSFTSSNCLTCGKTTDQLHSEGWITSNGVLTMSHDAGHVNWGGAWRMPTDQELDDLQANCDKTWTVVNGTWGRLFRGRGKYASKSIFLPASGRGDGTQLIGSSSYGYYWSSQPDKWGSDLSLYLRIYGEFWGNNYRGRYYGLSVRPVQGVAK